MENMEINLKFWKNRSVFLTGHTGFKGGWLALWLTDMGAKVHGYSLEPKSNPNFFNETRLKERLASSTIADIQDISIIRSSMSLAKPSIIIHMAAQSLVLDSYNFPVETFKTNIIGTANVLETARKIDTVEAIVNVTSDKCYENNEQLKPNGENDKLGGHDPYSSSKACAELISNAYRNSYFNKNGIKVATVRAGNVIGGGDWAPNRLVPDLLRSVDTGKKLYIRSPNSVRPWQHVLEPLSGYIMLAEKLVTIGNNFAEAWNFGPQENSSKSVSWMAEYFVKKIPNLQWCKDEKKFPHEANLLFLNSSKAMKSLNWKPQWSLEIALDKIIEWHLAWKEKKLMSDLSISQIKSYINS
jgi:CDP-glucose 4,6-dehydratase